MTLSLDPLSLALGLVAGILAGVAAALLLAGKREKAITSENTDLAARNAALGERNTALEDRLRAQAAEASALEQRFTLQFENLANRIFDEKTTAMKAQNSESLTALLAPLRDTLAGFQQKVEDSAKEQFSLKNEIRNIMALNENMRVQTEKLTTALRGDVKAQGGWGEMMLERILEASGLRRDEDYIVQGVGMDLRHSEDSTRRLQPDVIIKLPEDKHIIVDAKVSLTAYERLAGATDEVARTTALGEFNTSVKAHIKGLSERRYQDAAGLGTPDFVLMFMPIEGAYALALQSDPTLHNFAWEQRIVIVGPSTLFATLRTIASVWRLERQNKNAEEIARQGGNFYDKLVTFVGDMETIGNRLQQTQKSYQDAMGKLSSGTGNLLKRAESLKALGLKTGKSMPKNLLDSAEAATDGDDNAESSAKTARLS